MDNLKKKNLTRRSFVKGIAGAAVGCACYRLNCFAATDSVWKTSEEEDDKKKENLVAVCGLYCGACPMYIATQTGDEQKQRDLLKQFSAGPMKLKLEDLLCDGCIGGDRVASFCRSCEMRACPNDKKDVVRCSDCSEFPCSRITSFNNDGMWHHAEVLNNLEQIRKMGIKEWAKYDEERWQCPKCRMPMAWYDSECSHCGEKRSERLFPLPQGNNHP
jgi:hypothetical protein